jgi:hypothetical protein
MAIVKRRARRGNAIEEISKSVFRLGGSDLLDLYQLA